MDASPGRTWLLTGLAGFYIVLLAVGALVPRLDFYLRAVCRGPADSPWVALTFDDGPDPAITHYCSNCCDANRSAPCFSLWARRPGNIRPWWRKPPPTIT